MCYMYGKYEGKKVSYLYLNISACVFPPIFILDFLFFHSYTEIGQGITLWAHVPPWLPS